jgi:hypothetical protein
METDWQELFGISVGNSIGIFQADEETVQAVYDYLISCGYSPAGACGIMGNIQQESGFNPSALSATGNYYGICQWGGNRRNALLSYGGDTPDNLQTQLDYLVSQEMSVSPYSTADAYLRSATDASESAAEFCSIVEGCVASTGSASYNNADCYYNGKYWQNLDQRKINAVDFYNTYASSTITINQ